MAGRNPPRSRGGGSQGRLRPVVDRVFSMPDVAEAQRYMESNRNIGKIVVRID